MGYQTKMQLIERKDSKQFYVSIPAALAASLELCKGEAVEWVVEDKYTLVLERIKER